MVDIILTHSVILLAKSVAVLVSYHPMSWRRIARKNSPEVNVAEDIEESNNELRNDYIDNDEELSNVLLMTAKEEDSWVHVKR